MMALLLAEDSAAKAQRRGEIIAALLQLPDQVRDVLALDSQIRRWPRTWPRSSRCWSLGAAGTTPPRLRLR
jgi:hypothetical protein